MEQSEQQKHFTEASDLLQNILAALVDHPEQLKILYHFAPPAVKFTIMPAPVDVAVVLGRSGHMMRALREIFLQLGKKKSLSFHIDVMVGMPDVAGAKCIHCGCSQENACVTPAGPCSWWRRGIRNVCSSPSCITKEQLWERRN